MSLPRIPLRSSLALLLALAAAALVGGCGGGQPDDDTVLAEVGDRTITAADYRFALGNLAQNELPADASGLPVDTATPSGRRAFLDHLVDRAVMVAKAEDLGIDQDADIAVMEKSMFEYYGVMAQYADRIESPAGFVSEEELADYYEKLAEVRTVKVLITDFEDDALAARQRILAGEDWNEVAEEYHTGPLAPGRDPYLNKFRYGTVEDNLEAVIFDLKPGEVSQPFRNNYGYWLIRLEDVREGPVPPLEEIKAAALEGVRQQKIQAAQREFLEMLTEKYEFRIDPQALLTVYNGLPLDEPRKRPGSEGPIPPEELEPLDVPPASLDQELYSYREGEDRVVVTIGDMKAIFDEMNSFNRPKADQPLGFLRAKIESDVYNLLLLAEARANGYLDKAVVEREVRSEIADAVAERLLEETRPADETVTPAEIDSFYTLHEDAFVAPETRRGHAVFCRDREQAQAAVDALNSGQSWAEVVARFDTRPEPVAKDGATGALTAPSQGAVASILFDLETEGAMAPPAQVEGAWVVAQLDSVAPSRKLEMSEVRERIGRIIRQQRRDVAAAALLAKWRDEIGVTVYEDALAAMPSWEQVQKERQEEQQREIIEKAS